ncbi:RNB domain-containing ribonuclease [Deinococcus maricopensis]|uniref:Ribonuclease II n=1 Tax=Deinococcus maricopensis (strain DSM 21211 / LMG 22137 / NRRL B-23946 / LB-34) TaxID=709986 RepID=E8U597_DEIML|nr:RNB domain-containing ribonuclease [Deinococcus maricopensis]ADV66236.1 ribonuclease II [Deinococcus maricopensis DSM 21211]
MTAEALTAAQRTDLELIARGKQQKSRTLRERGLPETPEAAHALLLQLGLWTTHHNPHPERGGVQLTPPQHDLPDLPDEARTDLTHLTALAIDDDGNQDPDDALSLETLPDGTRRLWVHVADVAALIPPDSPADLEARARGATLYLPEGTVPMLPPAVVERLGLGLQDTSPALSISIDFEGHWEPTVVDVVATTVRVTRLTYRDAQARLDAGDPLLVDLAALAGAHRTYREDGGAVTITLPEVKVTAQDGDVHITPLPPLTARTIVQECMMLAGWAAAVWADDQEVPLPYAAQDAPHRDVRGDTLAAHWARRKTLARTRFQTAPAAHRGMGLDLYAQATSPMRRYLDLVVHQQLRAVLRGDEPLAGRDIAARTAEANMSADAVRAAERASRRHWTLKHLANHPERVWDAVIVERRGPQAVALIPDLALDTTLHSAHPVGTPLRLQLVQADLPNLQARFREVNA